VARSVIPVIGPVQRGARLDVEERDVVGQHVVQLPRDPEPLLAHYPPRLRGSDLGPLGGSYLAHPERFAGGEEHPQQAAKANTPPSPGQGPWPRSGPSHKNPV